MAAAGRRGKTPCPSDCLQASTIPALRARRPRERCPHVRSGPSYPTLLICAALFIRKRDSKAARSTACTSADVQMGESRGPLFVQLPPEEAFVRLSVRVCVWQCVRTHAQRQVSVTAGSDLCYSNAVCPLWVFLWKLSLCILRHGVNSSE